MTEPSPARPVPGPPRSAPVPRPSSAPRPAASAPASPTAATSATSGGTPTSGGTATSAGSATSGGRFADLAQQPVAEHVAVFEAEHARLQQELSSIDQL